MAVGSPRCGALFLLVSALCFCESLGFITTPRWCQLPLRAGIYGGRFFGKDVSAARHRSCMLLPQRGAKAASLRMSAEEKDFDSFPSMKTVEYYSEEGSMEDSVEARSLGRVEEIGLFPLGLVLNPGATLPLHIFEMRYRQLFNSAWDGNQKVSMHGISEALSGRIVILSLVTPSRRAVLPRSQLLTSRMAAGDCDV